jgi:hypothetical protein
VTKPKPSRWAQLLVVAAAVALFATACGGGNGGSGGAATSEQAEAPNPVLALAEQNQAVLQLSDDLSVTDLLDIRTGEITDLSEVVTGDRAVLVWYWAPH